MTRTILAATAAALLAGVTFGIAAPNPRAVGPERPSPEQMAENASAMSDARIAALKAGLRLTPDQDKLWPALETALRGYSDQRIEARKEWREHREARRDHARPGTQDGAAAGPERGPGHDAVAQLQQRADRMLERGSALKELASAAQPLYETLDPAQRHRFNLLFREAQGERFAERGPDPRGPRHGMERGWERGPGHGGGYGPGLPPPGADPQRL